MTRKVTRCSLIADRRGVSAVEFALVMPVFLFMMLGVFAYGSYLSMVHGIQQLTAEAARAAVGGLTDAERQTIARDNIRINLGAYPFLSATDLSLKSAQTDGATGVFSVTVRYDASRNFIFHLPNLIPMPNPLIERTASIQRGGY